MGTKLRFLHTWTLLGLAVVVGILWGGALPAQEHNNDPFEYGDGVDPEVPGTADILGAEHPAPDWQDLFNADGSLKDELDENGDPGGNGVADFLEVYGGRDAVFIADDVSKGSLTDLSIRRGTDRLDTGPVPVAHEIGNAYAYLTADPSGNLVLYAGVERLNASSTGASHVELEFNQGHYRLGHGWPGTLGWEIVGQETVNDVRLVLQYADGLLGGLELERWSADQWWPVLSIVGEGCNAEDSGADPPIPAEALCLLRNGDPIPGGDWPNFDDSQEPTTETLARDTFAEVSVNLGALFGSDPEYTDPEFRTLQLRSPEDLAFAWFGEENGR